MPAYEAAMNAQREQSRAASHFANVDTSHAIAGEALSALGTAQAFTGYEHATETVRVSGLFQEGQSVNQIAAGAGAVVVLESTPFYAESGGQIGDRGRLRTNTATFEVSDTRKQGGLHLHLGCLTEGTLALGDEVQAEIDDTRRAATRSNHSATHLLHAALRQTLGEHVEQKGSLVEPDRLRFDFAHTAAVTPDELLSIERLVNAQIRANHAVETRLMNYRQALDAGAMALFGEKYGDEVRVLSMAGFSVELCGGTHVSRTGDIGVFRIVAESGIAAGVRRIEAVSGAGALEFTLRNEQTLRKIAAGVKASGGDEALTKIAQLADRSRAQEKEIQALKSKLAGQSGRDLADGAVSVGEAKLLVQHLDGADATTLREAMDRLKDKLQTAVIVLATVEEDKVKLVAGVTSNLTAKVNAGQLANFVAGQVGGKGGGRPDLAQAGGPDVAALPAALESVQGWVAERLG
jgi:alanyl-tRNA synthetase